jgi:hypothetical protein
MMRLYRGAGQIPPVWLALASSIASFHLHHPHPLPEISTKRCNTYVQCFTRHKSLVTQYCQSSVWLKTCGSCLGRSYLIVTCDYQIHVQVNAASMLVARCRWLTTALAKSVHGTR